MKARLKITLPGIETYKKINENQDSVRDAYSRAESCIRYQFNYFHEECIPLKKHRELKVQGNGLVRADSYSPTRLKLYCIQGNAAEMTSIKGTAVGGSFRHFAKQSFSNVVQTYEREEGWLGFRCLITSY